VPVHFAVAGFLLYLVPGLVGPYGPFIDELYYVSCAARLDWGYVDHPPFSPFVLHLSRALLGDGLLTVRIPAAFAGSLVVLGVGLLARRLGAGRWGQAIACGATLAATILQILFGFYSMNAFEVLFWFTCTWILVEIELQNRSRFWLLFGLVAGIGLENKHTMAVFGVALGSALLLTSARRHLAGRWIWLGLALALILLVPNVLWQATHGWPSLEFYRNATVEKNVAMPPHAVFGMQILFMNPGTLPVWLLGLVFWLRRRDFRHVGFLYLLLLAMALATRTGRPDRIAGMYPVLLAAGGVMLERLAVERRWVRRLAPAWLLTWGVLLAPVGLPILPPVTLARYATTFHLSPQMEQGAGKQTPVPQWFADRLGWDELVADVAAARDRLTLAERERVVYFAPSYGQAGALEWLGRGRGLGPVYCTHNTWFLWGPPGDPIEVAIVLGDDPDHFEPLFEEIELAGIHDCELCMPWRDEMPIWIVRRPRVRIADRWNDWKQYE
jgi:hypothetical protein